MSRRVGVYGRALRGRADPGSTLPFITAEMRCHYPPTSTLDDVLDAINAAALDAIRQVAEHHAQAEAARRILGEDGSR